jgi:alkaline phosphatase
MKRLFYFFLFVCVAVIANAQAKYVFYFIGDGMGVNQVNGTEMYVALYADESVPYREIVRVLNIANENHFKMVHAAGNGITRLMVL